MRKLLIVAVTALFAGSAFADQMVRYTDSNGNRLYAESMEMVPEEYRSNASVIRVRSRTPKAQKASRQEKRQPTPRPKATQSAPTTGQSAEDLKNALRFAKPIKLIPASNKTASFEGVVINSLNIQVTRAKIALEVIGWEGDKPSLIKKSLDGKSGPGVMDAGETVKVSIVTNKPVKKVTGFYSRLSWETTVATSIPQEKPSE